MRRWASVAPEPRVPHALVALLVARAVRDVLRVLLLRELEQALRELARAARREDSEHVRGRNARAGHVAGEEDAGAEGRKGVYVEVFLARGVCACGYTAAVSARCGSCGRQQVPCTTMTRFLTRATARLPSAKIMMNVVGLVVGSYRRRQRSSLA